jgi:predicted AlkP superfamily phosphohydrolase/phosphomutase
MTSENNMEQVDRIFVLGLDCMTPQLVFERWVEDLPNFKRLMTEGVWGKMQSVIPAITVPAWMCMMTSKDPGRLGVYGFRNRKNYTYDEMMYANALVFKEPTVWDYLSRANKRSIVVGVPGTYPTKPINGELISCFMTPDTSVDFTYPKTLKQELIDHGINYILDTDEFRTNDKDRLLKELYQMTEERMKTVHYLLDTREWDFFMVVEMGPDRVHHGFWSYMEPDHPKYVKGNPYEHAIFDYYKTIDREMGKILKRLDDRTLFVVVSDHGAKTMDGGICLNDWLIKEGYLTLKDMPKTPTNFKTGMVDWSKTKAWGSGGYYGRLFLNMKGREPEGMIPVQDYEKVRSELIERIEAIPNHLGKPIGTKVFRPEDIYPVVNGIAPDLLIYFGDLDWRSVGTVGNPQIWTFENDTGPDDANHAQYGIFGAMGAGILHGKQLTDISIMDIAPTILNTLGRRIPEDMQGKALKF